MRVRPQFECPREPEVAFGDEDLVARGNGLLEGLGVVRLSVALGPEVLDIDHAFFVEPRDLPVVTLAESLEGRGRGDCFPLEISSVDWTPLMRFTPWGVVDEY